MDAALELRNDSDILLIDGAFRNYYCAASGIAQITYANSDMNPGGVGPEAIVDYTGVNPMIAINCARHIRHWRENLGGNNWRFRFTVDDYFDATQGRPFPMEWYIFDRPVPSGGNAGLQLFDADSNLVYDSTHKCMRVTGAIMFDATFPVTGGGAQRSFRFSNSKTAVLTCQQAMKLVPTQIEMNGSEVPAFEYYTVTARVEGSDIYTLDRLVAYQIGSAVALISRPRASFLALDVTGYM